MSSDQLPQPVGRPQGGMKSEAGRAAYWRMNYESAIQALADLIAENTENVEALRELRAGVAPGGDYAPCEEPCHHSECEVGNWVRAMLSGTPDV